MRRNQPEWLEHAVFYEIYPQSFKDSNADGIGDFGGIAEKLDYIKELGCNAIWMNPCFMSPFGDAGYDVSDYYTAAPRYGTNEDLKKLFEEIHKRDMRILLDLVPGHTSVDHKWFRESMKAGRNEYTDRYIWTNSIWEEPQGISSIKGISDRDGCCAVNFFSHQPALNYGYYKPDPGKNWQQSMDSEGAKATLEGEPDKSLEGGFHMDFLLHFGPSRYNDLFRCEKPYFGTGGGDVSEFVAKYIENYEKTNKSGLICIPSGNHDMDRLARNIRGDNLKVAFAFLLSMPGAPFIYYVENLTSVEGGYGRTGSRSPMQWDDSVNAGFSSAPSEKLYIPLDGSADRPTAADQLADENSLLNEVKKLIKIRRSHKALESLGEIEFVFAERNAYPFAYLRSAGDEKILVILNPSDKEVSFKCGYSPKEAVYTFGGDISVSGGSIAVPKCFAGFYRV